MICEKMDLVKMWNRVKCFITNCSSSCMSVILSALEYHYDIKVSDHTKCVFPHCHTFGLLSHHGRLGAGGLRRSPAEIAARWRYRPPIKNMTAHYDSQFCVSFHCCLLQEAPNRLWTCLNGAKT